ncbi:MAG TPA: PUA domain-containing protein, partial [Anaerolineaceae bacterium]|nr:PUA domain-containing protein [Anaerolineaceae bacterium]
LGTGGMLTKLQAADLARHAGVNVVITRGALSDVLLRLAQGEALGTHFLPVVNKLEARKRYILSGSRTHDEIQVDAGAVRALTHGGSLLPAGMTTVGGDFERGDTVRVVGPDGKAIAVGLTNYACVDLAQLCGKHSAEIETCLGYTVGDEVVHHNNMVLL